MDRRFALLAMEMDKGVDVGDEFGPDGFGPGSLEPKGSARLALGQAHNFGFVPSHQAFSLFPVVLFFHLLP